MSRKKYINRDALFQPINVAAELTGLSRYYLLNGCKDGTIPHIRVGVDYRVNMKMLMNKLNAESKDAGQEGRP